MQIVQQRWKRQLRLVRMKENKIKKANTSPEGQAGSENMSTADVDAVMQEAVKNCKKVEDDCEIFL